VIQIWSQARIAPNLKKQEHSLWTVGFLPLSSLRVGILALNRILKGIIPQQMAILVTRAILTRIDQIEIISAIREATPLILKITDLVDLIIDKDRHMTITTPLGGMGIGITTTLKTEGFIRKKADHRVPLWIEIKWHKGMVTDHHLLNPLTDKQIQEEIGVDKTTITLKTQGFTNKRIGCTTILPRGALGGEEKIVCLNLLHPHTHNLKIVWEEQIGWKETFPKPKMKPQNWEASLQNWEW
jgi:hypothetical protein